MAFMEIQLKSNMLDMNTTIAVIYPEHIEKSKKSKGLISAAWIYRTLYGLDETNCN